MADGAGYANGYGFGGALGCASGYGVVVGRALEGCGCGAAEGCGCGCGCDRADCGCDRAEALLSMASSGCGFGFGCLSTTSTTMRLTASATAFAIVTSTAHTRKFRNRQQSTYSIVTYPYYVHVRKPTQDIRRPPVYEQNGRHHKQHSTVQHSTSHTTRNRTY